MEAAFKMIQESLDAVIKKIQHVYIWHLLGMADAAFMPGEVRAFSMFKMGNDYKIYKIP